MKDELWFSAKHEHFVEHAEKFFFDSDLVEPLKVIEENLEAIRSEYEKVLHDRSTLYEPYFQKYLINEGSEWHTIPLIVFGVKRKASASFPLLTTILEQTPDLIGGFFSRVSGHSEIQGHSGITNIYRCHIGMTLPKANSDSLGMKVGNEVKKWSTKRFFAFNDANFHSTWNKTGQERIILVVDILKPELRKYKYYIFSRVTLSYIILKIDEMLKSKYFDKFLQTQFSKRMINMLTIPLVPLIYLFIHLQRLGSRLRRY